MRLIGDPMRRLVTRLGYEVRRTGLPALDLERCLRNRLAALGSIPTIHVFDDDSRIQREIFHLFGPDRARFHRWDVPTDAAPGGGPFWVELGAERCEPDVFFGREPWARDADLFLVRCTLGPTASGACSFSAILGGAEEAGFRLEDASVFIQPIPFNAANNRVVLLFSKKSTLEQPEERSLRLKRIDAAKAFLAAPLADSSRFQWLAHRGSYGYEAGVFNPGAIADEAGTLILARAEHTPWAAQELDEKNHMTSWRLFLLRLDSGLKIVSHGEAAFRGPFENGNFRVEDFRLFRFEGQCLCSHSLVSLPDGRAAETSALRLERLDTRIALSRLDPAQKELVFLGFPSLDLPTRKTEKNWAMMAGGEELSIIYSMAPYRVLRATAWPKLEFKTALTCALRLPFGEAGPPLRNSINPIPYDDRHFLHIVHKAYPSKQYVFWALLIDKRDLRPVYVSRSPLLRAGASVAASIVYVCSAVAEPDRICLFGGINDCGAGVWPVSREALDRNWQTLPRD
jgi:predicted GH43/DUF377 family glycosyl hydrolase